MTPLVVLLLGQIIEIQKKIIELLVISFFEFDQLYEVVVR